MVVDILGSSLLKKMKNKWIFANKKKIEQFLSK